MKVSIDKADNGFIVSWSKPPNQQLGLPPEHGLMVFADFEDVLAYLKDKLK